MPETTNPPLATDKKLIRGEVAYLYAFDVAYDMQRQPLTELLGQKVQTYSMLPSKRNPKYQFFYRPEMVTLPPVPRVGPNGPVEVRTFVKIFGIGAISIQVRVPFAVENFEDLVDYHDLSFQTGPLDAEVRELAEQVRQELLPHCIMPVAQLTEGEAYTVFCFDSLPTFGKPPVGGEQWLEYYSKQAAGLLTQEEDVGHLSDQEAVESTAQYLSYYENDLIVVDWDAALVAAAGEWLDDTLHVMELANVQLVELSTYDTILDSALQSSYRDVAQRRPRSRTNVARNLREIRVDLARLGDELLNTTKFFGDWHLAKLYQNLFNRFHLGDWHRVVNEKRQTLDDLYQLLQQDRTNFWMMILEVSIVVLFVLDLVILLLQ